MRGLLFIVLLMSAAGLAHGQVVDHINVNLKVLEKSSTHTQPLPNAELNISDQGKVQTDQNGRFNFVYAVRQNVVPKLSVSLNSSKYKTLKPLDASIELDPSREEVAIEFLVVNMDGQSEEFKKRIIDLEGRVGKLKAKNELTQRQLNALNERLVDTIMYFENIRQELQSKIVSFENLTEAQKIEIEDQKNRVAELQEQVDVLTQDLEAALEERYLRQNQYFKDISSNVMAYLRKAKDLQDHLPYINTYFSSPGGYQNFDSDIKKYNQIWEQFDNNRQSYLEGVERYWENPTLSKKVEQVFDYMAKGIHLEQILTVMNGINAELHSQKPRKAQKVADDSYENMNVNLRTLEKDLNRVMKELRESL